MKTRPATREDLIPGNIVFKGNGKTEWVIVSADADRGIVGLAKATSKMHRAGNAEYHFSELKVAENDND